ncbi:MAG TPA: CHAD domain-containing protein [Chitinophagaceae bacterium]
MENRELRHIVHYYFKRLNKNAERMKRDFNEEAIHLFRVDVKKLRAFLRLMRPAAKEPGQLKFPTKFKKLYSLAGKIRDRQLYLERIRQYNKAGNGRSRNKIYVLQKEIKELANKRDDFPAKKEFKETEDKLIQQLPVNAEDVLLKNFFQQKLTVISEVVSKGDYKEKELHSIRKSLKDIIYVTRILRDDLKIPVPFSWWDESELKKAENLSHTLGLFNDACIALAFLPPADIKKSGPGEREHLQALRRKWLAEKRKLKKEALNEIPAIQYSMK